LSEEKKKMNYYYGGKEKSAQEIKKSRSDLGSYSPRSLERDFNRMIQSFQRDFEDFWDTSKRAGGELEARARTAISPVMDTMMPSVDLEDKGKMFHLTVDLPGFRKEDVQVELTDDSVTVNAKRSTKEDEKGKNYVRQERSSQTFYRRINLPEEVLSDEANAKLDNGVLEVSLPKKAPKETKKLTVA